MEGKGALSRGNERKRGKGRATRNSGGHVKIFFAEHHIYTGYQGNLFPKKALVVYLENFSKHYNKVFFFIAYFSSYEI